MGYLGSSLICALGISMEVQEKDLNKKDLGFQSYLF